MNPHKTYIIQRQQDWRSRGRLRRNLRRLLAFGALELRAIFYIDGFNFYYLRTKHLPQYKWLNSKLLADKLVDYGTNVISVNYYTAYVSGKIDSDAPRRQMRLLSAMRTVPEINIIPGKFLASEKWAGLVHPAKAKPDGYIWSQPEPEVVLVKKTEEKGSDVNLGAHLVRDAFLDYYDIAYVITNDTDLVEPIRIVTQEVGKRVCIVAPCKYTKQRGRKVNLPAQSLKDVSTFVTHISNADLAASQFPDVIQRQGKKPICKPATWVATP